MSDLAEALSGSDEPDRPFLGRSVQDGKIRFSSVSQIKIFRACNRQWAFQYIFGKKQEETPQQRAGKQYAKSLEHYFKTLGEEDVLLPVLRAAKHYFPIPGPDLEVEERLCVDEPAAIRLREQYLAEKSPMVRAALAVELKRVAGLTANNIPILGAADYRHKRGEYIDGNGILQREDPGMRVVEIGDLKTTSRINDYVSRQGDGRFYQGYAKTVEQILADDQMLGYGEHAANIYPDTTHLRLSQVFAQTKHGSAAAKRTGLLTVEEVRRRWRENVEPIAREMEIVASIVNRTSKPEDAAPNLSSCIQFGKPCPHSDYCDRPKGTVLDLFQIKQGDPMAENGLFSPGGAPASNGAGAPQLTLVSQAPAVGGLFGAPAQTAAPAGLFSAPAQAAPPPPAIPPLTDAERAAQTEAERARLAAEDARPRAKLEGLDGYTVGQPCNGGGFYANSNGSGFIPIEQGHSCPACVKQPQLPSIGAINPADGKVPDWVESASALPPEAIQQIQDPALRAKVEEHARLSQERALQEQANQPQKKGGRCPGSGQRHELTQAMIASRKTQCPGCKKDLKIKDKDFTNDFSAMTVPNHNLPKDETPTTSAPPPSLPTTAPALPAAVAPPLPSAAPATSPSPAAAPPPLPNVLIESGRTSYSEPAIANPPRQDAPPALPQQTTTTAPTAAPTGVRLYVDAIVERGPQPTSLEEWYQDIVKTLTAKAGLQDIRYAPNNHDLAYGRWKPALGLVVAANPLPPGEYLFRGVGESEMKQVVLEALAPLCERVMRFGR